MIFLLIISYHSLNMNSTNDLISNILKKEIPIQPQFITDIINREYRLNSSEFHHSTVFNILAKIKCEHHISDDDMIVYLLNAGIKTIKDAQDLVFKMHQLTDKDIKPSCSSQTFSLPNSFFKLDIRKLNDFPETTKTFAIKLLDFEGKDRSVVYWLSFNLSNLKYGQSLISYHEFESEYLTLKEDNFEDSNDLTVKIYSFSKDLQPSTSIFNQRYDLLENEKREIDLLEFQDKVFLLISEEELCLIKANLENFYS